MSEIIRPTERMKALLKNTYSERGDESNRAARVELSKALELPARQAIFAGDNTGNIFETFPFDYGRSYEFPLDAIAPGTEKDWTAYTIPGEGDLPTKHAEGDYVTIPTYEVGNSVSWLSKYARDADWNVVGRMMRVFEAGFIKKKNDDAWHVLIATGADRNIIVYDSQAGVGQFTKRFISLAKTVMRRNGGGNSTSQNRGKLTDLYLSPEMTEDMRNWGIDIVDELTRREIYLADDGSETISRVFGVNLHDMDELGESQEYQNYYTAELGASLASGRVELLVGLDLRNRDSFINPLRKEVQMIPDMKIQDFRRDGYFGWGEWGWASLDNRRVLLGSA
jgi:hypothetical protein